MSYSLAQVYLHTGHLDEAIQEANRTLRIARYYPLAFNALTRAYTLKGSYAEAGKVLDDWERVGPEGGRLLWRVEWLALSGHRAEAQSVFASRSGKTRNSLGVAAALTALGDTDGALDALEKSVARHDVPGMTWLKVSPDLQPLRAQPRYLALLALMGVPANR
jgi:tetratricopeptide (TPR) repeat protein